MLDKIRKEEFINELKKAIIDSNMELDFRTNFFSELVKRAMPIYYKTDSSSYPLELHLGHLKNSQTGDFCYCTLLLDSRVDPKKVEIIKYISDEN